MAEYKVGDIIVMTGSYSSHCHPDMIFRIKEHQTGSCWYVDAPRPAAPYSSLFRQATPAEARAYHQGIRKIGDIKPETLSEYQIY